MNALRNAFKDAQHSVEWKSDISITAAKQDVSPDANREKLKGQPNPVAYPGRLIVKQIRCYTGRTTEIRIPVNRRGGAPW